MKNAVLSYLGAVLMTVWAILTIIDYLRSDHTMDDDEARSERQFLRPINPDPITKRIQNEKPLPKKEAEEHPLRPITL